MRYLSIVFAVLVLTLGLVVCPQNLNAQGQGWEPVGPPGAQIMRMIVHPQNPKVLWAGTSEDGIFKSVDGGTSWTPANQGLDRLTVQGLAVAPADPRIVYTASGGRFYRSTNGGQSWAVRLPCGNQPGCLPFEHVLDLVVDPRNPQTVFALTFRGLFKTTDGGTQWRKVRMSQSAAAMVFDPVNPKIAYATAGQELYKSTNGGSSWFLLSRQSDTAFNYLAIDPKNPRRMWSGTTFRLLRSMDGGKSWQPLQGAPYQLSALAVTPAAGAGFPTLWAGGTDGIQRSLDGGKTWKVTLRNHWVKLIVTHPQVPGTLWTGVTFTDRPAPTGIFKSIDRGASWTFSSRGIYKKGNVLSLVFDPETPNVLWTASWKAGVLRSGDGGLTWTEHNQGFQQFLDVAAVAVDPDDPQTIWAGTNFGVYVSEDGGGRWVPRRNGLSFASIQLLRFAPSNPSIVYAVTQGRLFRTENSGQQWAARATTFHDSVTLRNLWVDPRDPDVLLTAWNGIWISRNGGFTWTELPTGTSGAPIGSLAVDPRDPDALYAGSADGVFRSADGGQSWEQVADLQLGVLADLTAGPEGEVWAGGEQGIYYSPDGVSDWALLPGLTPTSWPLVFADPHHASTVYVSTSANSPSGDLNGLLRHTGD